MRFIRPLLLVAAIAAAACGAGTGETTGTAATSADLAPFAFTAETVDGETFDTAPLVGSAPVAFWAWAPWCPTCNREAPGVRAAIDRFGDKVHFIGVPGRDRVEPMRVFVDRHDLGDIPHVVDADGELWRRLRVPGQPTWVLVGVDGTVERIFGLAGDDELNDALRRIASTA